ncbi:hypothetical protein U1Q18_040351 [Sarracenia purpurea var. burkii]
MESHLDEVVVRLHFVVLKEIRVCVSLGVAAWLLLVLMGLLANPAGVEVYSKCPDYLLPGKIADMEARINLSTKYSSAESEEEGSISNVDESADDVSTRDVDMEVKQGKPINLDRTLSEASFLDLKTVSISDCVQPLSVNLADNLDVARMDGARRNQVQTVGRPSENAFKAFDEKPNPNSWNKQCEMPRSLISRIGPLAVSEELGYEALNHEYGVREKQVEEKPKIKGSEVDLSVRK